jgi:DtxR family transcriptional regulator, Mn-dependent transcriptional regulator
VSVTDTATPTEIEITEPVENFLKAVFMLQQRGERVSTNELAETLGKTHPTITDMAQRLMAAHLIDYQKYHGVMLTPAGQDIAVKVLRRHRLIELYLVRELGYELQEVHAEAERLEHAVSDRFVEALATRMGNPQVDPHGDSIPAPDGTIPERALMPLSDLPVGEAAKVSRLQAANDDMLQYILERGFQLGTPVQVTTREPFDGPITVTIDGEPRTIGHNVAACIDVE